MTSDEGVDDATSERAGGADEPVGDRPGAHAPEGHAAEGLAHLQSAAREAIRAARALLDAAEQVVDDPATVQRAVGTVGSLISAVTRQAGTSAAPEGSSGDDDAPHQRPADGHEDRIQRIRVS